jgi:hypothetical protein
LQIFNAEKCNNAKRCHEITACKRLNLHLSENT